MLKCTKESNGEQRNAYYHHVCCIIALVCIEGSRPEWYISSMLYSRDIPFWSGTLCFRPTEMQITAMCSNLFIKLKCIPPGFIVLMCICAAVMSSHEIKVCTFCCWKHSTRSCLFIPLCLCLAMSVFHYVMIYLMPTSHLCMFHCTYASQRNVPPCITQEVCVCVWMREREWVCVCVCVCLTVIISLYGWGYFCVRWYGILVLWVFFCMFNWMFQLDYLDTYCFECLICMRFVLLYLHLFIAVEHVSHGKAL